MGTSRHNDNMTALAATRERDKHVDKARRDGAPATSRALAVDSKLLMRAGWCTDRR